MGRIRRCVFLNIVHRASVISAISFECILIDDECTLINPNVQVNSKLHK